MQLTNIRRLIGFVVVFGAFLLPLGSLCAQELRSVDAHDRNTDPAIRYDGQCNSNEIAPVVRGVVQANGMPISTSSTYVEWQDSSGAKRYAPVTNGTFNFPPVSEYCTKDEAKNTWVGNECRYLKECNTTLEDVSSIGKTQQITDCNPIIGRGTDHTTGATVDRVRFSCASNPHTFRVLIPGHSPNLCNVIRAEVLGNGACYHLTFDCNVPEPGDDGGEGTPPMCTGPDCVYPTAPVCPITICTPTPGEPGGGDDGTPEPTIGGECVPNKACTCPDGALECRPDDECGGMICNQESGCICRDPDITGPTANPSISPNVSASPSPSGVCVPGETLCTCPTGVLVPCVLEDPCQGGWCNDEVCTTCEPSEGPSPTGDLSPTLGPSPTGPTPTRDLTTTLGPSVSIDPTNPTLSPTFGSSPTASASATIKPTKESSRRVEIPPTVAQGQPTYTPSPQPTPTPISGDCDAYRGVSCDDASDCEDKCGGSFTCQDAYCTRLSPTPSLTPIPTRTPTPTPTGTLTPTPSVDLPPQAQFERSELANISDLTCILEAYDCNGMEEDCEKVAQDLGVEDEYGEAYSNKDENTFKLKLKDHRLEYKPYVVAPFVCVESSGVCTSFQDDINARASVNGDPVPANPTYTNAETGEEYEVRGEFIPSTMPASKANVMDIGFFHGCLVDSSGNCSDEYPIVFRALIDEEQMGSSFTTAPEERGMNLGEVGINVGAGLENEICVGIYWDPYGVVFDAYVLEPISGVSVTLLEKQGNGNFRKMDAGNALTNPYITKDDGAFSFFVQDGTYRLIAEHPDYIFPANRDMINRMYAQTYDNVYFGDDIIQKGAPVERNIPLMPKDVEHSEKLQQEQEVNILSTMQNFDAQTNEYIIQGKVSHPLATVVLYGSQEKTEPNNRTRQLAFGVADKKGIFTLSFNVDILKTNERPGELEAMKQKVYIPLAMRYQTTNPVLRGIYGAVDSVMMRVQADNNVSRDTHEIQPLLTDDLHAILTDEGGHKILTPTEFTIYYGSPDGTRLHYADGKTNDQGEIHLYRADLPTSNPYAFIEYRTPLGTLRQELITNLDRIDY